MKLTVSHMSVCKYTQNNSVHICAALLNAAMVDQS